MRRLIMAHDVLEIENGKETLIIASDNSGAIGEKEADEVRVPYEVVAYFNFRVCFMESLAAGAQPSQAILLNFNGDAIWKNLKIGIAKACDELGQAMLPLTGSTESNFEMIQSAIGLSLLGRKHTFESIEWHRDMSKDYTIAVIGKPLVGPEVVAYGEDVASLKDFQWLSKQNEVIGLMPVGSKGIKQTLSKISTQLTVDFPDGLDTEKTSGPATCYLAVFEKAFLKIIQKKIKDPIFVGEIGK